MDQKPEGYPEVGPQGQAMPWPSAKDDMSLLESGVLGNYYNNGYFGHHDDRDYYNNYYYCFEESKSGKFSNPRLLALVEFSRELYFRRRELFKDLFPHLQDQFHGALKKSGMRLWRVKSGSNRTRFITMQRSLSLGSPRSPGARGAAEPPLRNEWIKVRTIKTTGAGSGDQQGQGGSGGQGGG